MKIRKLNIIIISLLIRCLLFCGCGDRNSQNTNPVLSNQSDNNPLSAAVSDTLVNGKVTDTICCLSNRVNSYALFLPSNYQKNVKFPVIFFFDPHAKGSYPLHRYKELAEKSGYVMVGSNIIKNGMPMEVVESFAEELITDVSGRIHIDGRRTFFSGFSGGSRVAAHLAGQYDYTAGVIGCGAGSGELLNMNRTGFSFLGFAGNTDFNYLELKKLDQALDNLPVRHYLHQFSGKHEWPPAELFKNAFIWMDVDAMRKALITSDDSLIKAIKTGCDKEIKALAQKDDLLQTEDVCKRCISFLEGFTDVNAYKNRLENLEADNRFINLKKTEETILANEYQLQQVYLQHLQNKEVSWWTNESRRLISLSNDSKSRSSLQVKRLLSYLSLGCYMYAVNFLNKNELNGAERFVAIYKLVDETNPEAVYLNACVDARKEKMESAISELRLAVKLGFDDVRRLECDSNFAAISKTEKFAAVIEKLKK